MSYPRAEAHAFVNGDGSDSRQIARRIKALVPRSSGHCALKAPAINVELDQDCHNQELASAAHAVDVSNAEVIRLNGELASQAVASEQLH
jgi:hypothetical protein